MELPRGCGNVARDVAVGQNQHIARCRHNWLRNIAQRANRNALLAMHLAAQVAVRPHRHMPRVARGVCPNRRGLDVDAASRRMQGSGDALSDIHPKIGLDCHLAAEIRRGTYVRLVRGDLHGDRVQCHGNRRPVGLQSTVHLPHRLGDGMAVVTDNRTVERAQYAHGDRLGRLHSGVCVLQGLNENWTSRTHNAWTGGSHGGCGAVVGFIGRRLGGRVDRSVRPHSNAVRSNQAAIDVAPAAHYHVPLPGDHVSGYGIVRIKVNGAVGIDISVQTTPCVNEHASCLRTEVSVDVFAGPHQIDGAGCRHVSRHLLSCLNHSDGAASADVAADPSTWEGRRADA